jgi:hypothetical protein
MTLGMNPDRHATAPVDPAFSSSVRGRCRTIGGFFRQQARVLVGANAAQTAFPGGVDLKTPSGQLNDFDIFREFHAR